MDLGVIGLWWGLTMGMAIAAAGYVVRFRWMVRNFSSVVQSGQ